MFITLTTETNIINISDKPNEGYEPIFYTKAQYFTSRLWSQLSSVEQQEFTKYAGQLHVILRQRYTYRVFQTIQMKLIYIHVSR